METMNDTFLLQGKESIQMEAVQNKLPIMYLGRP